MNFRNLSKISQVKPNKIYEKDDLEISFYENYSRPITCLVEFEKELLFVFPVIDIIKVKDINIQQIKDQIALLASEELYVNNKHFMITKKYCEKVLRMLIEDGISEDINVKINKLENLHKDELKEFEDNKFKILEDLKNRGLEVKFSCDKRYNEDRYQFKLKDYELVTVYIVTDYPTDWTITGSSTEYQIYNAIDVITLLQLKLRRPLMEEDFIGEVLDTVNKKPN